MTKAPIYHDLAKYYDQVYHEIDYKSEARIIQSLIKKI